MGDHNPEGAEAIIDATLWSPVGSPPLWLMGLVMLPPVRQNLNVWVPKEFLSQVLVEVGLIASYDEKIPGHVLLPTLSGRCRLRLGRAGIDESLVRLLLWVVS